MANRNNTFLLKRSNVAGNKPTAGQLLLGELALNTADAIIYTSGTTANSILPIGWDRISRTGDTMTGPFYAPTISATTYQNLPSSLPKDFFISTTPTGSSLTYLTDTYRTIDLQPFVTGLTINNTNEVLRNNDDLFFIGNWDDSGTTNNIIIGLYGVKIIDNVINWDNIEYNTLPIIRTHASVMNRGFIYGTNRPLTATTIATVIKINPYNLNDVKTLQFPSQIQYSGLSSDIVAYKDKLYIPFINSLSAGVGYMAMVDSDLNNYQSLFSFGNISSGRRIRTQTPLLIYNDEFYIPTVNNASQPSAGNTIGMTVYNMWGGITREVSGITISSGQTSQPYPHWMGIFNGKIILSQSGNIHRELLRFDANTLALEENITLPSMVTDDNTIMSNGYVYLNGEVSGATLTKVKYNDFTDISTEISNYNGGIGSYGSINYITDKDTVIYKSSQLLNDTYFTGGTVTGATNFTNGLTANTILTSGFTVSGSSNLNGNLQVLNEVLIGDINKLRLISSGGVSYFQSYNSSNNDPLPLYVSDYNGNNLPLITFRSDLTTFNGDVVASTLSATTYKNLPLDIRVTGGTYSSGTAVFRNNTGGTFSVSGFSTGSGGTGNSDIFSKEILTISDLTTNSGFVNTESGIKGGTIGTENFTLSFPTIDYTRKFRIDVVLKIKNAANANAIIEIKKSGNSWQGLSYLQVGSGNLAMNKTHLNSQGFSNIPSDSTFQYSLIGNGKRVIRNIIPLSVKWDGTYATTYLPIFSGQIISQTEAYNYDPSGTVEMFKDINEINVTGTNTNEITIESINIQYFDDATIYEHKKYLSTLMDITILNDSLDDVYPSYLYCPPNIKGLIQWHHPNGYNGTIDSGAYGNLFPGLFNDGYAICFGTFNSFNNPYGTPLWGAGVTSSNWGAPSGMVYRKILNDYCDSLINADHLIQIGGSMGGFNALTYATIYPDKVKAVVSVAGALDLTYNYNNGFTSVINKAYGAAYRCISATTGNATSNASYWLKISDEKNAPSLDEYTHPFYDIYSSGKAYIVGDVVFENYTGTDTGLAEFDLILNPRNLTKMPILLIHGDSDTTISDVQSIDLQSAVNGVGGNVTLKIKTGLDHLDIALFNYNDIDSFLNGIDSFTGGTVTGPTYFTSGLTATTISATTYLNLPTSGNYLKGTTILNFGTGETNSVINTISSSGITNSGINTILFKPSETTETSLDDFTLNGVSFNIENIIDNVSFDIRASAINNASGNYTINYSIGY